MTMVIRPQVQSCTKPVWLDWPLMQTKELASCENVLKPQRKGAPLVWPGHTKFTFVPRPQVIWGNIEQGSGTHTALGQDQRGWQGAARSRGRAYVSLARGGSCAAGPGEPRHFCRPRGRLPNASWPHARQRRGPWQRRYSRALPGAAAAQMQGALAQFGLDSLLYGNEAQRLGRVRLRNESDRSTLALMLFVAAGCLADPAAAVATVEKFAQRFLAMDIGTVETSMGTQVMPDESGPLALGLLRIVNGAARPPIYPLSPAGSTIGSLASGPNAITDVDVDVSRQHLRIWRDGSRWVCQGLGSTNGTMLISGADKSAQVVEPPRSGRSKGTYPPVALERGDILCLGRTTRFLVMALQGAK